MDGRCFERVIHVELIARREGRRPLVVDIEIDDADALGFALEMLPRFGRVLTGMACGAAVAVPADEVPA